MGKFTNWWTPHTLNEWHKKTKCLSDFYSKFEVLPGVHVNGDLTNGENIADVGGVKQAFNAYRVHVTALAKKAGKGGAALPHSSPPISLADNYLPGYTNEQPFFIACWCLKIRPEAAKNAAKQDVHAPAKFRVNGP